MYTCLYLNKTYLGLFLGDIALDEHDVTTIFGETVNDVVDSIGYSHKNPFKFDVDQEENLSNVTSLKKKKKEKRNYFSKKCGRTRRQENRNIQKKIYEKKQVCLK